MSNKAKSPIQARAQKNRSDERVITEFIHHLTTLSLKLRIQLALNILFRRNK